MSRKMNPATSIVQRAQGMYPKYLKSVVNYFGDVPYGQQRVSQKTADQRLARMSPEEMAQLAMTDPVQALTAQRRLQTLQERSQSDAPLPAQGEFEGEVTP